MSKTTYAGYLRQLGTNYNTSQAGGATPAVFMAALIVSFDPTASTTATGVILPKGARVVGAISLGGATGGTSPTVNIGTSSDEDHFFAGLDADTITAVVASASVSALTDNTEIYAGKGSSAASGGTTTAVVLYVMDDDGSRGVR